jgi:ubiquinone/menaquinone biosynthesis C-methylase UbiE
VISVTIRLITFLLRPFYYLLYHQLAWTYDSVASIISLGRWPDWVRSSLPFLNGRVLEIGSGPGHLQLSLHEIKLQGFGLDESRQMVHISRHHLNKNGGICRISRGYAQHIPFASGVYDSVVATFPAEYIFDLKTLFEIRRVLKSSGKLVILPMAWITGTRPFEQLAVWFYRVSRETPGNPGPVSVEIRDRITYVGFEVHTEVVELKGSQVQVIIAMKR